MHDRFCGGRKKKQKATKKQKKTDCKTYTHPRHLAAADA